MYTLNKMVRNDRLLNEKAYRENLGQAKTTFDKNVSISKSISLASIDTLSLNKTVFFGMNIKLKFCGNFRRFLCIEPPR